MFELLFMKKQVNMYVRLIVERPEIAKIDCEVYLEKAKKLKKVIEECYEITVDEFKEWCDSSVEVWNIEETNIFTKLKRKILMGIINYHLNSISKELAIYEIAQKDMDFVCTRLNQFYNFTVYTKRI